MKLISMDGYDNSAQVQNLLDAVPEDAALPAGKIYARQATPRTPRRAVTGCLQSLVEAGHVEEILAGRFKYYRKRRRLSAIAVARLMPYTRPYEKDFSLDANVDRFLQYLSPLRQGKSVTLWMELPTKKGVKKTANAATHRLVVITPGTQIGLPSKSILVSIVKSGSAVVRLDRPKMVADLVLAGMPAVLAAELINKVSQALKGVI